MSHGTVFIVEDDRDIREGLSMVLKNEGYTVYTAEHGADALQKLQVMRDLPCVVLLDVMMPVMDGLTFVRTLEREHHELRERLEIVIISASVKINLADFNALSLIRKPINLDVLLSTVDKLCQSAEV